MRPRCIRAFFVAILPLGLSLMATASPFTATQLMGKIKGVVLDPYDARIVGATITIKSDKLNRTIRTDDAGEFEIEVPISSYQISAEAFGFKKSDTTDLRVSAGEVSSVSSHLFLAPVCTEPIPPFDDDRIERQNAPRELGKKIKKRKIQ